ncbi:hypothetical protein T07_208 [Trichinella nelsoni]|uniref:Uncharacterized protein n=1 Tax=Trichinella nelsoni TaxID=6336 RepID=A0A0V0SD43_9BILA|nr:hypothetical protein T07_208 [Trichinella nelsoni]
MQITIAITLPYHQFKEWSKEKVPKRTARSKSRTAQSRTTEDMSRDKDPWKGSHDQRYMIWGGI